MTNTESMVLVGRSEALEKVKSLLGERTRDIHCWSDYSAAFAECTHWQALEDVLAEPSDEAAATEADIQRRQNDLRFVFREILASELRQGAAINETQEALRYLAVANHPSLAEW